MSIDWNTVQTAAVTAAVIGPGAAVLLEYAAKPRLEARKERILAAHRSRRDLIALIADIAQAAGVIGVEPPADTDPQLQEAVCEEHRRQTERLQDKTIDLFDNVNTRYSASYVSFIRNQIVAYASCVYGVVLSPRSPQRMAELVGGLSEAMLGIIAPQWWRPDRLAGYRQQLSKLITDANTPAVTATPSKLDDTAALAPIAEAMPGRSGQ